MKSARKVKLGRKPTKAPFVCPVCRRTYVPHICSQFGGR